MIKSDIHLSMHDAYALVRIENWSSNHHSNQLAISWNVNSLWFLSSFPDASGKSLLRKLGFGYMLSPMVAYTSRIIMQAIPARVIVQVKVHNPSSIRRYWSLSACLTVSSILNEQSSQLPYRTCSRCRYHSVSLHTCFSQTGARNHTTITIHLLSFLTK